jgi:hypothetical protein
MATGRTRGWCFTLNNWTEPERDRILATEGVQYLVFGEETGESGTPHLQGYIHFRDNITFKHVQKRLGVGQRVHLERRKGSVEQAIRYCKKDGAVTERGDPPLSQAAKGDREKQRWSNILALAEAGKFEDLRREYPREWLQMAPRLLQQHKPDTTPIDGELAHEWWVGPTGCGKSRLVWELYPRHYSKPLNKWWDNYAFEDVVVIEEWSPKNECTASSLKIWADRYAFQGEVKGAMLPMIRPKKVIVISNYTIEQCFPRKEDCDPLLRRFKVIPFPQGALHARARLNNFAAAPKPSTPLPPVLESPVPSLSELLVTSDEESGYFSEHEPAPPSPTWWSAAPGYNLPIEEQLLRSIDEDDEEE